MALTTDDKNLLEPFSSLCLSKTQVETILRRSLTEREWRAYNRNYKVTFSQAAKQASNVAVISSKFEMLSHLMKTLSC